MNVPESVPPNLMFFTVLALFVVWMQRNKRWSLFVGAADGTLGVRPKS
jgi:hypothetical protein